MWIEDIIKAIKNLNGYGHYSEINLEIEKIRQNLKGEWKAVVRRIIQQHSSDSKSWLEKKDVFYSVDGIGKGVWGLRNYSLVQDIFEDDIILSTNRVNYNISRIVRDTALSRRLKILHGNICQICNLKLEIGNNVFYSEGHHIRPLGKPHDGPDSEDNILILCPNCHVLCDNFKIKLDSEKLNKSGRVLNIQFINYHNERVPY
ncbi:HNH endonuclease [Flavobacterium sp. ACN6]|uniref:HNH endonuclease n=1 Tax=Flavobacterium sp. ACN6 TaxID=1920426 RepID=UPI000BB32D7A|nr:HNH endonuclease [Flavobacterium sp. ACN6]PBJ12207.1 HNH endonuclease [Flavobacterium sp. ACN6]